MNEIEEEILTVICNVGLQCSSDCAWCEKISEALINANYRKVKPVIIKINDKVEVHCDTMEDYDEFLKKIEKDIVNAGYIQLKTNGDYIRKMYAKSDEVLADDEISITYNYCIEDGKCICECSAKLVNKTFDTYGKAYNANLEWLQQEYKGEIK